MAISGANMSSVSSAARRSFLEDDGDSRRNGKVAKTKPNSSPSGTDYSKDVRKKLESSNRTGQACDRCRMRKMRCDGGIDGCAPCLQNRSPCRTTDRMTGVASERGYVRKLEYQRQQLQSYIEGLTARLKSLGEDVKPIPLEDLEYNDSAHTQTHLEKPLEEEDKHQRGRRNGGHTPSTTGDPLPGFREGLSGDNYLGVSSGNSYISSIRGTSLNVLGMEIDLADNVSPDLDEPGPSNNAHDMPRNKSYHAFIQSAFDAHAKPVDPGLPSRQEAFTYTEWCFKTVLPYLPILHKPSFLSLLSKCYDEPAFTPSPAESVIVHLVLAQILFQIASRNHENIRQRRELHRRSNSHYHYAAGFFSKLLTGRTLEDVQALAMLALHLRSFPKPGACWMVISLTLNIAIELGLHRSAKRWASSAPTKSVLEIEMRKRAFWSILTIHIYASGKLGRPMALSECDFDVELPDAIDDEALSMNGIDNSYPGSCSYLIGLEAFKSELIFLDMYSSIYTVRRSPSTYAATVKRLEHRITQWRRQWPKELTIGSPTNQDQYRAEARYLCVWESELRLLLRHPSLATTTFTKSDEENLMTCMNVSKHMLEHVGWLLQYKSLDTNWQTNVTYVLALSTVLYGHWVRKDQISMSDLQVLSNDMNGWLKVMEEVGLLMGSGQKLKESVGAVIDRTIAILAQYLNSKTNPKILNTQENHVPEDPSVPIAAPSTHQYNVPQTYAIPSPVASRSYTSESNVHLSKNSTVDVSGVAPATQLAAYMQNGVSSPQAQPTVMPPNGYPYTGMVSPSNTAATYANSSFGGNMHQVTNSWQDFTGNMMSSFGTQELLTPASTLVQLGNTPGIDVSPAIGGATPYTNGQAMSMNGYDALSAQQWPIVLLGGQPVLH